MDAELAAALTEELRGFVAAAGTRRALPCTYRVGQPTGESVTLPETGTPRDAPGLGDQGLGADVVVRALDGLETTRGACAWVTRGGDLAATDADAFWVAAARTGFARHGLVLPAFVVVTRTAWRDLLSGEGRTWSRVRARSPRR